MTSSWDGTIKLWDYKGNLINTLFSRDSGIRDGCHFLKKGKIILAGHRDGKISVFNLKGNLIENNRCS